MKYSHAYHTIHAHMTEVIHTRNLSYRQSIEKNPFQIREEDRNLAVTYASTLATFLGLPGTLGSKSM